MPQSLLGGLPVCHQRIFLTYILVLTAVEKKKKTVRINSFSHTCKEPSIRQMGSKSSVGVVIVQYLKETSKHRDLDPETGLFSCQTWRGHSAVKRTRTDLGAKGCDYTHRKHTQSEQTSFGPISRHHTVHIHTSHTWTPLAHEALATWYLNLPPGREWKICHSCYLLHSHVQRWPTAGWIAPLCSMMQCNGWRPAVIYLLCCGVYRGLRGGDTHWNHSAQSHFTVVWNPELSCVAFLYRLLACAVRSSTSLLPAAWLRAKHKSDKCYKA